MKKEREIYLKPLTHREQVVMEQGICAGSVDTPIKSDTKAKAMDHDTGFDGNAETNSFETTTWN
jgi:hypothetical protein